jgi:PleD family two-component response regulator
MKHARILVIEDDSDTADMLKIFFSSQGASVEIASTGEKAFSAVKEQQPDLILLDILLPDMDGYEIFQKLRSGSNSRHIPILFLTQKNSRSDILSGLEIGADDYLTKPFDLEELKLRVRNSLRRSKTYRQIDARTSLPTGDLISTTLSQLLDRKDWAVLIVHISGFEKYINTGQLLQHDEILGRIAAWLENTLSEIDDDNPFIGYLSGGDFLIITCPEKAKAVNDACSSRLPTTDRLGGDVERDPEIDEPFPVQLKLESQRETGGVTLDVGLITENDGPFEDVSALLDALFNSTGRNEPAA